MNFIAYIGDIHEQRSVKSGFEFLYMGFGRPGESFNKVLLIIYELVNLRSSYGTTIHYGETYL